MLRSHLYICLVAWLLGAAGHRVKITEQRDGDCRAAMKAHPTASVPAACLHFVHITKTGGTAVENVLSWQCGIGGNGHWLTAADVQRAGHVPLTIIREPVDRFLSAFWYWKSGISGPSGRGSARHRHPGFAATIEGPRDFIDALTNSSDPRHELVVNATERGSGYTTGMHWKPQAHWIDGVHGGGDERRVVFVCFSRKHLLKAFQRTLEALGVPCKLRFAAVNVSERPRARPNFTSTQWEWLQRRYARDFDRWEALCAGTGGGPGGHRRNDRLAHSLAPAQITAVLDSLQNYWQHHQEDSWAQRRRRRPARQEAPGRGPPSGRLLSSGRLLPLGGLAMLAVLAFAAIAPVPRSAPAGGSSRYVQNGTSSEDDNSENGRDDPGRPGHSRPR